MTSICKYSVIIWLKRACLLHECRLTNIIFQFSVVIISAPNSIEIHATSNFPFSMAWEVPCNSMELLVLSKLGNSRVRIHFLEFNTISIFPFRWHQWVYVIPLITWVYHIRCHKQFHDISWHCLMIRGPPNICCFDLWDKNNTERQFCAVASINNIYL